MYLKRVFILFYILTAPLCLFSQEKINSRDSKGKKQGHWIYYGKDRPGLGYNDDAKYEEGLFKNDRKVNTCIKICLILILKSCNYHRCNFLVAFSCRGISDI